MEDMNIEKQIHHINEIQLLQQFQNVQQPEISESTEILDEYQHTEMVLLTLGTIRQLFEVASHL